MSDVRYQCPCCGYYTLKQRGEHDICPVCRWQDDDHFEVFGVEAPERPRGPNRVHLRQARKNFLAFGASEERRSSFARHARPEELPENNLHQPPHRPAETLPPDLDLRPPLEAPRLTQEGTIAIARREVREMPPDTYSAEYGSLTDPRYRRLDDGAILEPFGTWDFWKIWIRHVPMRLPKREGDAWRWETSYVRRLVLVDDKAAHVSLSGAWESDD